MRLIVGARARRDLNEAVDFISADDPAAARRLAGRLHEAAGQLVRFPRLGVPHGSDARRILAVPGTPFRLIYRIGRDQVTILRFWHGARGWPPTT